MMKLIKRRETKRISVIYERMKFLFSSIAIYDYSAEAGVLEDEEESIDQGNFNFVMSLANIMFNSNGSQLCPTR